MFDVQIRNFRSLFPLLIGLLLTGTPLWSQLPEDFYDTKILDGFELALGITFAENGQGYIWEKEGKVYVLDTEDQLQSEPLLDISEEVSSWKDHGLNGFCLDNDFLDNGYFYLYYVVDMHHYQYFGTPEYHPDTTVIYKPSFARVVRYQADVASDFTTVVPDSRTILLGETHDTGVPILYEFHGAGSLIQGLDGTLLLSAGETTGGLQIGIGNEPDDEYVPQAIEWGIISEDQDLGAYKAQYLGTLNGKVLRIDPATGDGLASNPYYDAAAPRSAQSRIWAMGFRNPYRMMLRPNTGSHYAADGNPGTIYVGDVGNGAWEEIDVIEHGGQNFGWPVMEGNSISWKFWTQDVPANPLAPNPIASCEDPFFNFRDLLAQPLESGAYVPGNPCDMTQPIPQEVFPQYAQQPLIIWSNARWNPPARAAVPGWNDNGEPRSITLAESDSPVAGEMFDGYSSLAGVFYEGDQFPEAYRGKYFHVDFSGWIRTFAIDGNNVLSAVEPFHDYSEDIIHLAQNIANGALYYTNLAGEVHRITYGGNPAPVAVIEADKFYGPGPLTINFTAADSYDPNLTDLTYAWDFGDGTSSTLLAPEHTFNAADNAPTSYRVRLTVTDAEGAEHTAERIVSLNNTPPQVEISSFNDGDRYPLAFTSLLRLAANVTDAEHADEELMYEWRTFLHHNDHFHPDPVIFERESHFLISPLGCEEEIYFYRIELTVTDPEGLSTTVSQRIHPYCDDPFIDWVALEGTAGESTITLDWGTEFERNIAQMELQRSSNYFDFQVLQTITPIGNNTSGSNYQYVDGYPLRGANIYRVKVTTTDGAFTYSNLIPISYPPAKAWKVFPNPADHQLTFEIEEATAATVQLELFDLSGQHLRQITFAATPGERWQRELLVSQFPAGVYAYRLRCGEAVYVGEVVVK